MFENLKKNQRSGPHIPFTQVRSPKSRIIILCGFFVLLLVMAFWLKEFGGTEEAQRVVGTDEPSKQVPDGPVFTGVPALDVAYVDQIQDSTEQEQGRWDESAIAYLLNEARSTPAVWAYNRNLLPLTPESANGLLEAPKPWRYKFVRFRGEIEYIKEDDYADAFAGDETIGRVHYGRLRIADADTPLRVFFVTPTMPVYADPNERSPQSQVIKDGWVRGRGIFVKKYRDVGPDGTEVPTLLVVTMQLQRDFAPVPVNDLKDIPFQIIDDDPAVLEEGEDGNKLLFKTYPRVLFRLVKYAEKRMGEAGAALRKEEGLDPASVDDSGKYEEIVTKPALYRAKYFGGLGATVLDTMEVGPDGITDDNVNDAGVDRYITGWIYTDRKHLVQFAAPAGLPALRRKTRVRYEGYYYKTQAYYATNGTERMVPFLVLTRLEQVNPPKPDHTAQFVIAGAFILGIMMFAFMIMREDKTKRSYRHLRRSSRAQKE